MTDERRTTGNNVFKKLVVTCLNEHLVFESSIVLADSFVLRNRQSFNPAKCFWQCYMTTTVT